MSRGHPEQATVRRIVVALDPSTEGTSALEFAADLAAALGISLAGVFVEDVDLSEYAELPFAREVSLSGAGVRELSRRRMQSYYRATADRARRALEALGRARRIQYSFEWRRGRLEAELSAAAREADVLVITSGAGHRVRPRSHDVLGPLEACAAMGFLAFSRPVSATRAAGVWTAFTGSEESQRAVVLAARIASQQHTMLTVVALGAPDAQRDESIRHLAMGVARLTIHCLRGSLAEWLRRQALPPRLVVLPADLDVEECRAVRALAFPTLIIRAARVGGPTAGEQPS